MIWLFGLTCITTVTGVLVFVLVRDSFRAGNKTQGAAPTPSPGSALMSSALERKEDAARLNALAQNVAHQHREQDETSLSSLAGHPQEEHHLCDDQHRLKENPVLPQAPKRYLRMVVEHDNSVDRLLHPPLRSAYTYTLPSREFRIENTEPKSAHNAPPAETPEKNTAGE